MRQKLLSGRPIVTRTSRFDPRGAKLESVAAEFALLAQRRARTARQVDLLARQLEAATAGLEGVQARMVMLAQRMQQIDPDLAENLQVQAAALPANPVHVSPAQGVRGMYHLSHRGSPPPQLAPVELPVFAPNPAPEPMRARQWPRRRPFQPE